MKKHTILGLVALLTGIAYITFPYDMDVAWYGYIDDFFVFIAGYTFFMAMRTVVQTARRMLLLLSGVTFIMGMMSLIVLLLFA